MKHVFEQLLQEVYNQVAFAVLLRTCSCMDLPRQASKNAKERRREPGGIQIQPGPRKKCRLR